MIDITKMVLAK